MRRTLTDAGRVYVLDGLVDYQRVGNPTIYYPWFEQDREFDQNLDITAAWLTPNHLKPTERVKTQRASLETTRRIGKVSQFRRGDRIYRTLPVDLSK
jgi:hypothetical protein